MAGVKTLIQQATGEVASAYQTKVLALQSEVQDLKKELEKLKAGLVEEKLAREVLEKQVFPEDLWVDIMKM